MKTILTLILLICLIFILFLNQYLEYTTSQYKAKVIVLQKEYKSINKIIDTNSWVKNNLLSKISILNTKEDTESLLITFHTQNKDKLNLQIDNIDKSNKGYISINTTSTIARDDIEKLLALFRLKVKNGFVNIEQLKVTSSEVITKLQLIKAYKE